MFKIFVRLLLVHLVHHAALAQDALPILKANSRAVDVQDGDRLLKGVWTIDPAVALDVYHAVRTKASKKVTFITDVDSISFEVEPGRAYDFFILLDGRDLCRTRVSTMMQSAKRDPSLPASEPVTIPITISRGTLRLQGTVNRSETLDLIFDTGADTSLLYPSAMRKGATLRLDNTTLSSGTGGTTQRQTSSTNRLSVGGLSWDNELVMNVETQVDSADGIVSYRVFEDKVVEFDYDRMVMVIHDALPAHASEFAKTPMIYHGTMTAVEAILAGPGKATSGFFILDSAGNCAMIVYDGFATTQGLRGSMVVVGTSTSRGLGSETIRNDVVLVPELSVAGFAIPNVPVHMEGPRGGAAGPPDGLLCMEVLQRFNTILDYPRRDAYLRPNTLFGAAFKQRSSGWRRAVGPVAVVSVVSLAGLALYRAKRRRAA